MIIRTLVLIAMVAPAASLAACSATGSADMGPAIFYPPPPAAPRLQLLARYAAAEDVEGTSAFREFVIGSEEDDRFIRRAHGVAWWEGRIYVCDPGLPGVDVLDIERGEMRPLDPENLGIFQMPIDIAVAPDGSKYVTDSKSRKVLVFGPDDRYRGAFGDPERWKPIGIVATGDRLYVTDIANHAVVVLDRTSGEELRRIGKEGPNDGEFYYPLALTLGPQGDLYVSDSFHFRVQQITTDGTFVRSYGSVGNKPGQFMRPRGVAVDGEGRVYVADAAFENIQIFDKDGKLLLFFGEPGTQLGALNLPAGLAISREAVSSFRDRAAEGFELDHVLFATSQSGPHKVNVYGFLRVK